MEYSFHLDRIMQHPLQYKTSKMMMGIGFCALLEKTALYCFNEERTVREEVEGYIGSKLNQLSETATDQIISCLTLLRNRAAAIIYDTAEAANNLPTGKDLLNSLNPHWIQIERCLWNDQYAEHGAIICCHCPWNESTAIYIIVRGQEPTRIIENAPPGEYPKYDAYTIWNQNDYFVDPAENNPYDRIELQPVETLLKELVQNAYSPVEHWYRMQLAQIPDPVVAGRARDDCAPITLDTFLEHSSGAFLKNVTCWALDSGGRWIDAGLRSDNFGILDILAYQRYYFQPNGWEPTVYRLPKTVPQSAPPELEAYIKDILQSMIYNRLLRFSNRKIAPPGTPPNYAAVRPTYASEVFSLLQSMLFATTKALLYGIFFQLERGVFSVRLNGTDFLAICPKPSQLLSGWIDYYMPEELKKLLSADIDAPLEEKALQPQSNWHPNVNRDFRPLQLNMGDYTWDVEVPAQRKRFAQDLQLLSEQFETITIKETRLYSLCLHKLRGSFIRLWTEPKPLCLWQSMLDELSASVSTDYPFPDEDFALPRELDPADALHAYAIESIRNLFAVLENWNLDPKEQLVRASKNAVDFWLETFSVEAVTCARNKKVAADLRMKLEAFPYGSVREPLFGTMHRFLDILTSQLPLSVKIQRLDEAIDKFQNWYAPLIKIMHELSGRNNGIKNGQTTAVIKLCGENRENALQTVWRTLFKNCDFIEGIEILIDSLDTHNSLASPCVHISWKDFTYYLYWGWKAAPSGEYAFLGNEVALITAFKSKQNPYLTIVKSEVSSMNVNEFEAFLRRVSAPERETADWPMDIDEKIEELMEAIEKSIAASNSLQ